MMIIDSRLRLSEEAAGMRGSVGQRSRWSSTSVWTAAHWTTNFTLYNTRHNTSHNALYTDQYTLDSAKLFVF